MLESSPADHSKFGDEDTHCCVLGTEPCQWRSTQIILHFAKTYVAVPEIQISLAHERIKELNSHLLQHPSGPEYVVCASNLLSDEVAELSIGSDREDFST